MGVHLHAVVNVSRCIAFRAVPRGLLLLLLEKVRLFSIANRYGAIRFLVVFYVSWTPAMSEGLAVVVVVAVVPGKRVGQLCTWWREERG